MLSTYPIRQKHKSKVVSLDTTYIVFFFEITFYFCLNIAWSLFEAKEMYFNLGIFISLALLGL